MPTGTTLKIPFGLTTSGHLYEPLQVPNGNACGCFCPGCRQPLQAVHAQSGRVAPYFRHQTDDACSTGYETAIHLAAKQLIAERQAVWCPAIRAKHSVTDALGRTHALDRLISPAALVGLSEVRLEQWLPDISRRPDILADCKSHGELLIEIAVTHPADDDKRRQLAIRNVPALEIDLAHLGFRHAVDFSVLACLLFEPSEHARWLHNPSQTLAVEQFLEGLGPTLAAAQHKARIRLAEAARKEAANVERNSLFRDKPALDKLAWLERKLGSFDAWPAVIKTPNKHTAAVIEPCATWQGAVYLKFIHSAVPGKTQFDLQTVLKWMQARFHCSESGEGLKLALRYFLKVLVNYGVLAKSCRDGYVVTCNDPENFHPIAPGVVLAKSFNAASHGSSRARSLKDISAGYARWLKGTLKS